MQCNSIGISDKWVYQFHLFLRLGYRDSLFRHDLISLSQKTEFDPQTNEFHTSRETCTGTIFRTSWFHLEIVRNVDASSFIPPPRVKSCVIKVTRRKDAIIKPMHHRRYLAFLDKHLSPPQMPVSDSMKKTFTWNQVSRICKDAGINKNAPVISFAPGQWGLFFNTMLKRIPSRPHPSLPEKYRRLY